MPTLPPPRPARVRPSGSGGRTVEKLDRALVALANGDRVRLLDLIRNDPSALGSMAGRLGVSKTAVSHDLSLFHSLEYEEQLEELGARYDDALLAAAANEPGDRVLDIGCGSGPSARAFARADPTGSVSGIDLSAALVRRARARSRADGLGNVEFQQGDAGSHPFPEASFDVAVSRFGAMYFGHPEAAFAHIGQALRPGGRLALVAWQEAARNEWMTAVADALTAGHGLPSRLAGSPGAFGLADEAGVRRILDGAGFVDVDLREAGELVSLGPDAGRAYAMVSTQGLARQALDGVAGEARIEALDRLRDMLAAHETPEGVLLGSRSWIITGHRP